MIDPTLVDTYVVGQEGFIVGLCEALGLPETFNQALESINGRPTDIPYGIDAMIMMVTALVDSWISFTKQVAARYLHK